MEQKRYTVVEHLGGTVFGIASPAGDIARGIFFHTGAGAAVCG